MKRGRWVFLFFLLSIWCLPAFASVSSRVEQREGRDYVIIENGYMELTFNPSQGGICSKFVFKDTGEEIIGTDAYAGLFKDHWAKYPWPSGLMWLPYQYKIVGDGKQKVGVQLWVEVPAMGGGKGSGSAESSKAIPTTPDLIGLIVKKTIWLNADNDVIVVDQEIENPTKESRSVAPYIQNCLIMGGKRYYNNWYMPSTRGIEVLVQPDNEGGRALGTDWVLDPTAGWMGVIQRQTKHGVLFVFDYNYLEKIYSCGSTAEWFMDPVPVGPGRSFKYGYVVKPVRNFEDFVYASKNIVADIRPDEADGKVRVNSDIAAVSAPLSGVETEFTVTGWKSKDVISTSRGKIGNVGFDRVRTSFEFTPKNLSDGVVIKAVVRGTGFEDKYEYYYAGDKEEYERRYNPFATKGQALAGARGDAYFVKQPRKRKVVDKPDLSKIPIPSLSQSPAKVLVVFGLYTQILNIDDALAGWSNKLDFTWANCPPNAIETFPGTYDELFSYSAVVLSDVNYKAIGDIGFEMLCDYAERGGKLLVTGGPYAFGDGEYEGARFLDVLPVNLSGPFDLKWAGKGKSWDLKPVSGKERSNLLKGVAFTQKPKVFWHHFVEPRKGTESILEAGGKPVLVLGKYGKGKVAVLTLSPTGKENEGEVAWWNWDGWFPLVQNIFTWFSE